MDLTRAAIEKDRVTVVVLLFLIGAGLAAYRGLPRSEDPETTFRRAVVLTRLPGASPERVEHLVTDPLEAALQEIPEIDFVTSRSRTGISVITIRVSRRGPRRAVHLGQPAAQGGAGSAGSAGRRHGTAGE